jgi:DNA (cytosine-5)-methyltransferase 1
MATMDECGDADDCISTSEAAERKSKPSDEKLGICLCLAK